MFSSFFNAGKPTYEIEQSLRFDMSGTPTLTRTAGTATDGKKCTLSFWIKKCEIEGGAAPAARFAEAYSGTGNQFHMQFGDGTAADIFALSPGENPATQGIRQSDATFRDPSAWYHFMWRWDSVNGISKIYANGVELASSSYTTAPTLNSVTSVTKSGTTLTFGKANSNAVDMYVAEFHLIDGQIKDTTDFGEFDNNGVWRPIKYTGTHGNNGAYLKFDPSATNGIGHDHSGNGNNFTANNFTSSGTGTEVMSDTPTTNCCTWNPLSNNGVTISNGNLDTSGGSSGNCKGTLGMTSGKWYWEYSNMVTGTGTPFVMGLAHVDGYTPNGHDNWRRAVYFYTDGSGNGEVRRFENGSNVSADAVTVPSSIREFVASDVLQIAFDADTGKVWTGKNDSWLDSSGGFTGNPSNGSNPTHTFPDTTIPMTPLRDHAGVAISASANFGQRAFAYTPPTGFKALNTSNLPAPTVKDGSEYFNTVLYSGNGSTQSITGVGFSPSFVWTKGRSGSYGVSNHKLFDTVRGATKTLFGNLTLAEATQTNGLTSFDSDGFSLGNDTNVNASSTTFASWSWLAGGSGSSNTDGSITSTVSASPTAGFSIVSYTGTGSAATVGHGLGVPPALMIVKCRNKSFGWTIYHQNLGNTRHLDFTSGSGYTGDAWNSTNPTSTVFSVGTDAGSNNGSTPPNNYVAYCFAEVEGYSKFGSYSGNGSTDGPFVYCGFRPAWVMIKGNNSSSWSIIDTTRNPYNLANSFLLADSSGSEVTPGYFRDYLSNGIKIRDNGSGVNTSGNTYIFAAFAEHPTGGSGVSPATAR